ncbi:LOW QUALITY PROTEIN: leucine-rich repeat transmembrane neuronal protein 2-like [Phlebotomus argentipes]|uniref:LOW QUALITY PROTEIN: leucine-rich repeat transmembrane neuronal protein 2-like n=1 Tax=Phlebotomus argentipes TaxID=94469 RepID=UPI00289343A7|nr:LOW QUALITY PROTEIN: leucine-rich repeat transmembrane neuronal protein 2-like [Phlebotomus argentipes]
MLSHVTLFTALSLLLIARRGFMQESRDCDTLRILNASEMSIGEKLGQQTLIIHHLSKRLRLLERRLKSVEQPIWVIREGSNASWIECERGPCQCDKIARSISCSGKYLNSLPINQIVPSAVKKFFLTFSRDLSRNSLFALNRDSFKGLRNLSELLLSENRLEYISQDLFHGLKDLTYLKLSLNKIEHLHTRTFVSVKNLQIIDLHDNLFEDVHENLLNSLEDLLIVDLSSNKLRKLPENLLRNTTKLLEFNVSRNKIKDLKTDLFKYIPSLKRLQLDNNHLCNVPLSYYIITNFFIHTISLHTIAYIPDRVFGHLTNLQYLSMKSNKVSHITDKSFENLSSLITLDLAMNNIRQVNNNPLEGNLSSYLMNFLFYR